MIIRKKAGLVKLTLMNEFVNGDFGHSDSTVDG